MVLVEYEVGNFKALGSAQKLKLSPLTLIFGKNSAGKSSIIQSLLLCQYALREGNFNFGSVTRWGQAIDLGDFRQYVHRHDIQSDVSFAFAFDRDDRERTSSALDSQVERALLSASGVATEPPWSFCFLNDLKTVALRFSVGLSGGDQLPQVKKFQIEVDGEQFLEFERDESGKLALINVHLDRAPAIIALAAFAAQLTRFNARDDKEPKSLEGILEWINVAGSAAPKEMITRAQQVYHSLQEQPDETEAEDQSALSGANAALASHREELRDLLAQSEMFAALASTLGARVREVMKDIRADGQGLKIRQSKDHRLRSRRAQFNTDKMLDEEVEAIEDPIGFYLSEPDPEDLLTSLAKAFRFDVELLIQAVIESLEHWLGSTEYVGPFRWIPSRLSAGASSSVSTEQAEGGRAMKMLAADPLVFDKVSYLLQETLEAPYGLRLRKTAPTTDQDKLEEAVQRAVELNADGGKEKISGGISNVFRNLIDGRTSRGIYLLDNRNQTEVDFCDVGFGISQVLPLLIELAKDVAGVVCIEQPEVHIHPKMQAALGDVFINRLRTGTRRTLMILETHSEHIILRLLRRVRETSEWFSTTTEIEFHPTHVCPDELSVHWIEMINGEAKVTVLDVTPEGDFEKNWPEGFFEERIQELPL